MGQRHGKPLSLEETMLQDVIVHFMSTFMQEQLIKYLLTYYAVIVTGHN